MRPFSRPADSRALAFALAFVAFMAVAVPAFAAAVAIHPGVKAGIAVSNLSGELQDLGDLEARSAATFGGFVRFDVARLVSIVPGVDYVPKGARFESVATDEFGNVVGRVVGTYRFNYIEFPVAVRLRIPTSGRLSPHVYAAPSVAFATTRKLAVDPEYIGSTSSDDGEFDLKDDVRSSEWGMSLGAGAEFSAGPGAWLLDVRYEWALQEVFTAPDAANDKNRTLLLTLGYAF